MGATNRVKGTMADLNLALLPARRFQFWESLVYFACGVVFITYGAWHASGLIVEVAAGVFFILASGATAFFSARRQPQFVFSQKGVFRVAAGRKGLRAGGRGEFVGRKEEYWTWDNFTEARATRDQKNARLEFLHSTTKQIVPVDFAIDDRFDEILQFVQAQMTGQVKDLALEPWSSKGFQLSFKFVELRPVAVFAMVFVGLVFFKDTTELAMIASNDEVLRTQAVAGDAISDLDDFESMEEVEQSRVVASITGAQKNQKTQDSSENSQNLETHALSKYKRGPIPVRNPSTLTNEEVAKAIGLHSLPKSSKLVLALRDLVAERTILIAYRGLAHKNYTAPVADLEGRLAFINSQIKAKTEMAIAVLKKEGRYIEFNQATQAPLGNLIDDLDDLDVRESND